MLKVMYSKEKAGGDEVGKNVSASYCLALQYLLGHVI
jgi:hypothetical protein